jgi:DNA-binding LytR/AlgR family response regulator
VNSARVVIAEDDVEQAAGIAALVSQLRSSWKIHGLVHSRSQLTQALEEVVPDVLLLDLHMPGDGNDSQPILERIRRLDIKPVVILVTGDPTQALEAYESAVADYVVKPLRPARLAQALERAEKVLLGRRANSFAMTSPSGTGLAQSTQWLSGYRGRDIVLIDPAEVLYLQAERKYTYAHLTQGQLLMRHGISEVEEMLDMRAFIRIHRSTIVQIRYVDFIRRDEMGRLRVHMKGRPDGLVVSRSFEQSFKGI